MHRIVTLLAASLGAVTLASCGSSTATDDDSPQLQYGEAVALGDGQARSYVLLDVKNGGVPLEVGVAFSEHAFEGLPEPAAGDSGGHSAMHSYLLPLPADMPAPYKLVELNWNPLGHEPPGIYDKPHFDFHFYWISQSERDAIMPSDPNFATEAANFPQDDYIPANYMVLPPPPAPTPAVPMMGVHWTNVTAPEILPAESPEHAEFTRTFIYGSWNGEFTFVEPMVTLAFLQTKPDERVAIDTPAKYAVPGYYPAAYRVTYDESTKEYRVSITDLTQHQ